jgi:MFS family permease
VTGLVFAKLNFPQSDPLMGTLQAYAIFFVGFVARPVGAFIFGHFGDRIGRKAALIATPAANRSSGRSLTNQSQEVPANSPPSSP